MKRRWLLLLVMASLLVPGLALAGPLKAPGLRIKVNTLQDRSRLFKRGGFEHFKVRLRLQGNKRQMRKVRKVTYHLHPLFKKPDVMIKDRKSKFGLNLWTWGEFRVDATVQYRDGSHKTVKGYVNVAPQKAKKRSLLNRLLYGKVK